MPKTSPKHMPQRSHAKKASTSTSVSTKSSAKLSSKVPLALGGVVALGFLADYLLKDGEAKSSNTDVRTYTAEIKALLQDPPGVGILGFIRGAQPPSQQKILADFLNKETKKFKDGNLTKIQLKSAVEAVNNTLVELIQKQIGNEQGPGRIESEMIKAFSGAMSALEPASSVTNVIGMVKKMANVANSFFRSK